MTPLWVISLFVSLTEVVTGIAVTQATGGIQVALTAFVISFPLLVASAFFSILWIRPYVFYPPTEFAGGANVNQYVEAMRQRTQESSQTFEMVQRVIDSSIRSPEISELLKVWVTNPSEDHSEASIKELVQRVAEKTQDRIRTYALTIDTSRLTGMEGNMLFRTYDPSLSVSGFLDSLYFDIHDYVEVGSFGRQWALRDIESGQMFMKMGRRWAREHGQRLDERTIVEVGFRPGMHLEAVRL